MDDETLFNEPYDFDQCTIQITLQILPRGEGADRQVVIGVRNHQDAPLVRTAPLTTLALLAPLEEMLAQLANSLPERKLRKDERNLKEKEEAEKRKAGRKKAARSETPRPAQTVTAPAQPIAPVQQQNQLALL